MTTTEETGSAMGETPGASGGDDAILPFQLDRLDLRGGVVRLDKTLNQILDQHRYPGPVSALVGEAVLITALIGRSMKLRQRFSLQAKGDGAVSMIATDYFAPQEEGEPARLRAYAQFDADRVPEVASDPFSLLGEGLMAMTIDQGKHTTPYQGLTPLVGGGLASCAETYFAQSVQTATRFQLSLGQTAAPGESPRWRAGGVMLQHLPDFGEGATPPDAPSGGGRVAVGAGHRRHGRSARQLATGQHVARYCRDDGADRPSCHAGAFAHPPLPRGAAARLPRANGCLRLYVQQGEGRLADGRLP